MLIAENHKMMQKQYRTMEKWLKECNLEVNEDKTEYMVIGIRTQ